MIKVTVLRRGGSWTVTTYSSVEDAMANIIFYLPKDFVEIRVEDMEED